MNKRHLIEKGIILESEGGQVPQPYFLGGIVKGIKKAVGIGKAIGGVGKAVSGVLSNPIVGAVASFIPGAAPIVAGVQGIAGLTSGDPIGAALGAASFIPELVDLLIRRLVSWIVLSVELLRISSVVILEQHLLVVSI